jgi:hypothetical protein
MSLSSSLKIMSNLFGLVFPVGAGGAELLPICWED